MHHSSKGESLGKCMLCSLKAISCPGQSRYLFCTWKQMICCSFCFWARLISILAKRRKRKKLLSKAYCDNPAGNGCHADIWCPIPSQSCLTFEWPKPLKAPSGISCQEWPGENGAVAELRNVILSNRVCVSYDPRESSPSTGSKCFLTDPTQVTGMFSVLMEQRQCRGCSNTKCFMSFQQQISECVWIGGSSHQAVIVFIAISISIATERLMYAINRAALMWPAGKQGGDREGRAATYRQQHRRGSAPKPLPGPVTDVGSDAGVKTPSRLTQTINPLWDFSRQESRTNISDLSYLEVSVK